MRSVTLRIALACATILAMLALGAGTAQAQATIVGGGTYTTIQAAINAANPGDVINVASGTYQEQIIIAKKLTINGADGVVLNGATLGLQKVAVKIKSGDVTLNNVDVEHFSGNGIIVGYEATPPGSLKNVHITNCKISGIQPGYSHGFGIYVGYQSEDFKRPSPPNLAAHLDYSGLLIENNEITDSRSSALVLQSITGDPGTLMVRNNYIHDNDNDAIWIDSARNIGVKDNTLENNPDGIYLSSYGDAFQGVIGGQWIYDWSNQQLNGPYGPMNISITGNTIADNNTYGGVYLAAGYPATITINDNVITGNAPGVANYLSEQVNASCNWWGAANGPGPVGPGTGDGVEGEFVTFTPWRTSAGGACNGSTTPPTVLVPAGITAEATSASGAAVTFAATAADAFGWPLTPTCTTASGATFPIGSTPVTCTATDVVGNAASGTFTVTVQDTTKPTVTAALVAVRKGGDDESEQLFRVVFTSSDSVGVASTTALLNGVSVTNGQLVRLKLIKKGAPKVTYDDGILKIHAFSFTLTVTATDTAGNIGTASANAVFNTHGRDDDEHDGKDRGKGDDKDKKK